MNGKLSEHYDKLLFNKVQMLLRSWSCLLFSELYGSCWGLNQRFAPLFSSHWACISLSELDKFCDPSPSIYNKWIFTELKYQTRRTFWKFLIVSVSELCKINKPPRRLVPSAKSKFAISEFDYLNHATSRLLSSLRIPNYIFIFRIQYFPVSSNRLIFASKMEVIELGESKQITVTVD